MEQLENGGGGSRPRVAVLGAGYVGLAAARDLAAGGADVWTVGRRERTAEPGITHVSWDLAGAGGGLPAALPAALDAVVLCVAPGGAGDTYEATYPPAARAAAHLARETGAGALVYTSSTGVYGGRDGQWVTEDSPLLGDGAGNHALRRAEDTLLGSGLAGVTVLRVAGIYGPGRDPRSRYARPEALPWQGRCWVNLAHRDDIVAAIRLAAAYRGPARALNVADGSPAQARDVATWCATARGLDPSGLAFTGTDAPARANQRVAVAALLACGWRPCYPSYREGFARGL